MLQQRDRDSRYVQWYALGRYYHMQVFLRHVQLPWCRYSDFCDDNVVVFPAYPAIHVCHKSITELCYSELVFVLTSLRGS